MAACQVVEERVDEDEWSERKVNLPGIGSVPMIAAMSNSIDDGRRQVLDMRRNSIIIVTNSFIIVTDW